MSCKSAIYVSNNAPSTLILTTNNPGTPLPLGTIVRRFGCNLQLSGNGILADGAGYYDIDVSVTITPAAAGTFTVSILQDGALIPGATQSITATAGSTIAFNIPALARLQCCDSSGTITFALTTTADLPETVVVNNVGAVVKKL